MSRPNDAAASRGDAGHEAVIRSGTGSAPDAAAIREDYEGLVMTVTEICAAHGITRARLAAMVVEGGWTERRPRSGSSSARLVARMLKLMERQVSRMEQDKTTSEKDATLLGSMSRTLAKLMEIEASRTKPGPGRKSTSKDLAELRHKLARRIEQLNQG